MKVTKEVVNDYVDKICLPLTLYEHADGTKGFYKKDVRPVRSLKSCWNDEKPFKSWKDVLKYLKCGDDE